MNHWIVRLTWFSNVIHRKSALERRITSYNVCYTKLLRSILALVFIVPTMLAGIFDWQHLYAGRYLPYIVVKLVLAVVLTGLLGYSVRITSYNVCYTKLLRASQLSSLIAA